MSNPKTKSKTYSINPEHLDDMSPAQRAVVGEMLRENKRLNWLLWNFTPKDVRTFVTIRLTTLGLGKDEFWMLLTDSFAKMEPERFDSFLIEINHFIQAGMNARADSVTNSAE